MKKQTEWWGISKVINAIFLLLLFYHLHSSQCSIRPWSGQCTLLLSWSYYPYLWQALKWTEWILCIQLYIRSFRYVIWFNTYWGRHCYFCFADSEIKFRKAEKNQTGLERHGLIPVLSDSRSIVHSTIQYWHLLLFLRPFGHPDTKPTAFFCCFIQSILKSILLKDQGVLLVCLFWFKIFLHLNPVLKLEAFRITSETH